MLDLMSTILAFKIIPTNLSPTNLIIGSGAFICAYILAFIAWLWVYKASFHTGWIGALALAILAVIVFLVMSIILGAIFGIIVPAPFFPSPL